MPKATDVLLLPAPPTTCIDSHLYYGATAVDITQGACNSPGASANIATAQGDVSAAQQALATAQANASASNATAQNGVNTAQKALTSAQTTSTSNNATAQAKVSSDQVNLTLTTAQASSSNTTAQNTVNAAASALASARPAPTRVTQVCKGWSTRRRARCKAR